MQRQCKGDLRL